jgi:hypothetical protein
MNDDVNSREAGRVREVLDAELAGLSARPEALQRILTAAHGVQRQGRGGAANVRGGHGLPWLRARLPQWAVAAAAVAAVAVAVPAAPFRARGSLPPSRRAAIWPASDVAVPMWRALIPVA